MAQLHKRFTVDQVKVFLDSYKKGLLTREEVQAELEIGKTQFFKLKKKYDTKQDGFTLDYKRKSPKRIIETIKVKIKKQLLDEKKLIENPDIPITKYNYSAIKDYLEEKQDIKVSLPSIITIAKEIDCYNSKRTKKVHDREVITTSPGALVQHDASTHLWAPEAGLKWTLITSLDDFSRKMLYADFVEHETTWAHIKAAKTLILKYGSPLKYYVDQLRIFRFIQSRDSIWRKHVLQTDDASPQWKQVMQNCGVGVVYALSPQAKGKIERPYRWLQDRIVRTCVREKIKRIEDAREVLQQEVYRYNNIWKHSTTGEIPNIRLKNALKTGNSLFQPFSIPKPYETMEDIFCIRETRMVDAYHKVSLKGMVFRILKAPVGETIEIRYSPTDKAKSVNLRFWLQNQLIHTVEMPMTDFPRVHFSTFPNIL